ncbi:hypothetical protein C5167_036181, partial [Papaver somniferum]
KWDWSEDQIQNAFETYPTRMKLSVKKSMSIMDYLLGEEDCAEVFHLPYISLQGSDKEQILLCTLQMNQKSFLEKFVIKYEQAPELLKIYNQASIRRVSEDSQSDELIFAAKQVET